MPWMIPAAMIGSSIIGGAMGQQAAGAQRDAANDARQQALAQFAGIQVPDTSKQNLDLEMQQYLGNFNPNAEQTYQMGPTALNQVAIDPRLQQSQMAALQQLSGIAQTGMSDADKATFELLRRQAANEDQAKQGQILQEMQARGQGGSGAELIAKLKASQSSADRLNQQELQQAQMQQQARMAALSSQANLAGNIRSQDYGQQNDLARARDAISQFNTQNQQQVAGKNTATANAAAQQNLANQQQINNQNTGLRNQQQINNKGLLQQQFQNQVNLGAARSGQYNNQANANDNAAAQSAAMWNGIGQAGATAIGAYANSKKNNPNADGSSNI